MADLARIQPELAGGSSVTGTAPSFPNGVADTDEALRIFDALAPVEAAAMLGAWTGQEFPSGHPLDRALVAFGWQGKRFDSEDEVHPLVFRAAGGRLVHVNPAWAVLALPLVLRCPALKSRAVASAARHLLPLLATRKPRARLRMLRHRGQLTAAMLYDQAPIVDVFRRVDADTVLGLMDWRGMRQPFFFLLRRAR